MVPRSLFFAAAAIFGYVVLAIPGIGFIVAIFGGLFIPPILLNLAVIGTAIEVAIGNVARAWLLMPLFWFGGYATLGIFDRWEIDRLRQETLAENGAVRVAFDPVTAVLVYDETGEASSAVRRYSIPVAFAEADGQTAAYRIGDRPECEKLRGKHTKTTSAFGLLDPASNEFGGRSVEGHCLIREVRPIGLPAYRITSGEPADFKLSGPSKVSIQKAHITTPDGQVYVVKRGFVQPVGFIPFPMFGCYPDGGSSSCEGAMGIPKREALLKGDPVAVALGLQPVDWSKLEEREAVAAAARPSAGQIAAELAILDEVIADPVKHNREIAFSALKKTPHSFADRAEAIIRSIETSYGNPAAWSSGPSLVSLAASLPDPDWLKVAPRLLDLYKRSNWHWIRKDDALLARLGDLGAPAVPTLVEEYTDRKASALLGLCRAGQPARPIAGPVLLQRVGNPSSRLVNARAEIITLARMGLYDEAMAANDQRGRFKIPRLALRSLPTNPGREWCDKLSVTRRRR